MYLIHKRLRTLFCHPSTHSHTRLGSDFRAQLRLSVGLVLLFALPSVGQLPPNWADQDIGSPSQPGSASYANGIWTVSGGGADIWNSADQFHFVYTNSGASTAVALVDSLDNTDPWAKAG